MKRIRSRPRVDNLANQQRSQPIRWGRRIYLGLIVLLGGVLVNFAIGDALILRAEGLVVSNRQIIAATYTGKVSLVYIQPGQKVSQGDVLFELESADMLKDIAQLATQNADLSQREAELGVRGATAKALLPLAERHARQAADASLAVESVKAQGLITLKRAGEAIGAEYETAARIADLQSQSSAIADQLPFIQSAHERARLALQQLEAFYDDGRVRAGQSGIVGANVPVQGQVVKFGELLAEIHGSETSILAYLPDNYMFAIKPGQMVEVASGLTSVEATTEAVLSVADSLPAEFQNMFRPRDRSRLLRIALPSTHSFAVSQKVTVGGCIVSWCWRDRPADKRYVPFFQGLAARITGLAWTNQSEVKTSPSL